MKTVFSEENYVPQPTKKKKKKKIPSFVSYSDDDL